MARQVSAWRVHFNILKHKEYIMKKYASKQGSQLTKTANGYKFQISQEEWKRIGKEAGWLKSAQVNLGSGGIPVDPSQQMQGSDYRQDPEFVEIYYGLAKARRTQDKNMLAQFQQQLKQYCRKNNIDMTTNPDILELLGSVREF